MTADVIPTDLEWGHENEIGNEEVEVRPHEKGERSGFGNIQHRTSNSEHREWGG